LGVECFGFDTTAGVDVRVVSERGLTLTVNALGPSPAHHSTLERLELYASVNVPAMTANFIKYSGDVQCDANSQEVSFFGTQVAGYSSQVRYLRSRSPISLVGAK